MTPSCSGRPRWALSRCRRKAGSAAAIASSSGRGWRSCRWSPAAAHPRRGPARLRRDGRPRPSSTTLIAGPVPWRGVPCVQRSGRCGALGDVAAYRDPAEPGRPSGAPHRPRGGVENCGVGPPRIDGPRLHEGGFPMTEKVHPRISSSSSPARTRSCRPSGPPRRVATTTMIVLGAVTRGLRDRRAGPPGHALDRGPNRPVWACCSSCPPG